MYRLNRNICILYRYYAYYSTFWKSNKIMLNIINKVEKIFFSPESLEIYNSFKGKEYFITLGREELSTDTIINLLNKYLGDSQNIYVLFSGISPISVSEETYPIFLIKRENIGPWAELILRDDAYVLIVSSPDFQTVIDISNLDEEDGSDTRTVYLKNKTQANQATVAIKYTDDIFKKF